MNVGIITIIGNDNYGNRLQNYALEQKLKSMDLKVETLKNEPFTNTKNMFLLRLIKNINNKGTYSNNKNRRKNFEKFNKHINFSSKKINAFSKLKKYDYVIVGSDQVWNPNFLRLREVDLLSNVESKKRISYAASFGINDIPEQDKKRVAKELRKFKAISVREKRGEVIAKNLTGRKDITTNIDPTLLLKEKEWEKIIKKPEYKLPKKYILNYFLGSIKPEIDREIKRFAKENECEIINILDKKNCFYTSGPSEFLFLEKNAFLICTDSFHSSVFGLIFDRPFVVFDRNQKNIEKMNSRIETLVDMFKLKGRIYNGEEITKDNIKHNYKEAYKILENERQKSEVFLKKALDIKDSD